MEGKKKVGREMWMMRRKEENRKRGMWWEGQQEIDNSVNGEKEKKRGREKCEGWERKTKKGIIVWMTKERRRKRRENNMNDKIKKMGRENCEWRESKQNDEKGIDNGKNSANEGNIKGYREIERWIISR